MPEQTFSAPRQGASAEAQHCYGSPAVSGACDLPTHRQSWEAVQSSPGRRSKDRNLHAEWGLHETAFLNIFRLITSAVSCVKAGSPFSIHTHTCPIPPPSLLALVASIQQWGAAKTLGTSYFLSAYVIETICLTGFFSWY